MFHLTLNNKLDLTAACYLLSRYILHKKKKEKKKQTTRLVVEQQLTVCASHFCIFSKELQTANKSVLAIVLPQKFTNVALTVNPTMIDYSF